LLWFFFINHMVKGCPPTHICIIEPILIQFYMNARINRLLTFQLTKLTYIVYILYEIYAPIIDNCAVCIACQFGSLCLGVYFYDLSAL